MDALLILAVAFAAIIALGCGLVFLHDLFVRRQVRASGLSSGRRLATIPAGRKSRQPITPGTSATIVWVKAGKNAVRGGSSRVEGGDGSLSVSYKR